MLPRSGQPYSLGEMGYRGNRATRSAFTVVLRVPKLKVNVRHRHEGGEAGQDFGLPIGAKRLEFEVSLQPEKIGRAHV